MHTLFEPIQVGDLPLPNRVVMALLTRCRAGAGRVPADLMAEYCAQRASAGYGQPGLAVGDTDHRSFGVQP